MSTGKSLPIVCSCSWHVCFAMVSCTCRDLLLNISPAFISWFPVHLVTREAFALYLAHVAPDGIIAAHITNLHLDLQPVFWQLARYYDLSIAQVNYAGDSNGGYASLWILLSRDPALLQIPAFHEQSIDLNGYSTNIQLWTDDYSNLFQILK
jgi:hypothetical protein